MRGDSYEDEFFPTQTPTTTSKRGKTSQKRRVVSTPEHTRYVVPATKVGRALG